MVKRMIRKAIRKLRSIYRSAKLRYWEKRGFSKVRYAYILHNLDEANESYPLPARQKKWAIKRGFYPFRIQQYGLTDDNYQNTISDWDYNYINPINNQYRFMVINKLMAWYTLAPFREFLPKHYYHLMTDRGVLRLLDCPEAYGASLDGVISLIRSLGTVALKKTDGSHGVGFYKIQPVGDGFEANDQSYTEEEFRTFLSGLNEYILTEYIKMHPAMEKLNSNSVNTIRMTVVNEHGNDPMIPSAYMRIGTKRSGATDNVGSGGMICKIDVETGRFYDGEVLNNHVWEKSPRHPDTNEIMEGTIPNWELAKSAIIRICNYIPDLEWLGFDIAITPESVCIVEINTMQDLHKAHEYPDEIQSYLFRKLKKKKAAYGLKVHRG